MPDVIEKSSEEIEMRSGGDMERATQSTSKGDTKEGATQTISKGDTKENTAPNKEDDTSVKIDQDVGKGHLVADLPLKEKDKPSADNSSETDSLMKETGNIEVKLEQKTKCLHCSKLQIFFILIHIGSIALGITAIVLTQQHRHPPHVTPAPKQFHHAFFHLKTNGYTESGGVTNLQWIKDESQNVGNIKLVNETYFVIPQDGIYQITFAVQLYIPKSTPASIITLMMQRIDNEKGYIFMKKSSTSLNIPEHDLIQSSFRYKLKINDKIFLKMNMAKFISHNTLSSFLYLSKLA